MNPLEFLTFAARLSQFPNSGAAEYRTSVSRSYYGALHIAISYLSEIGYPPRRGQNNTHKFTHIYLMQSACMETKLAGKLLANLQAERNHADYDLKLHEKGTKQFAMACLERAHEIVSLINLSKTPEIKERVKNGIQAYLNKIGQ